MSRSASRARAKRKPEGGRHAVALLACACLASACAASGKNAPTVYYGGITHSATWREAEDELSITMRAIAPQLERGGVAAQDAGFRGFLTTTGRVTHPIRMPAHTCATLVAIASRGVRDMDAALYNPEGELLAADAQPDAHPTIQLCSAGQPKEFYYALHVYEGAGSFLMVPFFSEKKQLEAISERLGARPAVAHFDHGGVDPIDRVAAFGEGVRRRGFEATEEPIQVPLTEGQPIRITLPVEPANCYTAAGFAVEGTKDIGLRILDDEGSEIARDEGPGDAALQFCARRAAQFAAEMRAPSGKGSALLTVYRAAVATVGGPAGLWLGERPVERPSDTPLPEALELASQRARQDGFSRRRNLSTRHFLPGQAMREPINLPARRCTRIYAVGGPGVRSLRLTAADAHGLALGHTEGGPHSTYLHVCSSSSQEVQLSLNAAAGSGEVALVAFDAPLSRSSVVAGSAGLTARFHQAAAEARDAGYRPHPDFEHGPHKLIMAGSTTQPIAVDTKSARCVRAFVLSADPEVQAKLLHEGHALASVRANAAPVHACGNGEQPIGLVDLAVQAGSQKSDAWLMLLIK